MQNDWQILSELKKVFHDAIGDRQNESTMDYWKDVNSLNLYDQYFAERIAWKWGAVWDQIREDFWRIWHTYKFSSILDFGCGTGVSGRIFFKEYQQDQVLDSSHRHEKNLLHSWQAFDRSILARKFTEAKIKEQVKISDISNTSIEISLPNALQEIQKTDLVLLSHVLNEMDSRKQHNFSSFLKLHTKMILILEAGDPVSSRNLVEFRERLLDEFLVLKPCPHQNPCPLLSNEEFKKDWCHFFARSPSYVSQSSEWREFSKAMNLDLRRQALSFVWLIRKDVFKEELKVTPKRTVVGLSEKHKAGIQFMECSSNGITKNKILSKKKHPKELMDALKEQRAWFLENQPSTTSKDF